MVIGLTSEPVIGIKSESVIAFAGISKNSHETPQSSAIARFCARHLPHALCHAIIKPHLQNPASPSLG
jgi:hypothetical protein